MHKLVACSMSSKLSMNYIGSDSQLFSLMNPVVEKFLLQNQHFQYTYNKHYNKCIIEFLITLERIYARIFLEKILFNCEILQGVTHDVSVSE